MFIRWLIENVSKRNQKEASKLYPMVFSIHEMEIREILFWMRNHNCSYNEGSKMKGILSMYTDDEIIENGLVSMAFEQYSGSTDSFEGDLSLVLMPSCSGTRYKLHCKCGEEFEPFGNNIKKKMLA